MTTEKTQRNNSGSLLWNFLKEESQEGTTLENWREHATKLKLEPTLVCPIGNMYLSRFLSKELCLENLNAYHDIRSFLDYSNMSTSPEQELKDKAKKLEQYYFDYDSPFERKYNFL